MPWCACLPNAPPHAAAWGRRTCPQQEGPSPVPTSPGAAVLQARSQSQQPEGLVAGAKTRRSQRRQDHSFLLVLRPPGLPAHPVPRCPHNSPFMTFPAPGRCLSVGLWARHKALSFRHVIVFISQNSTEKTQGVTITTGEPKAWEP